MSELSSTMATRVATFVVLVGLAAGAACTSFDGEPVGPTTDPSDSGAIDNDAASMDGAGPGDAAPPTPRPLHPVFAKRLGADVANTLVTVLITGAWVEPTGAISIAGTFEGGSIRLGGPSFSSGGNNDAFAARLDAMGGHASSMKFGDGADELGGPIATTATNTYVGILYEGAFNIKPGQQLTNTGELDSVVARFNGTVHSTHEVFGSSTQQAQVIVKSLALAPAEGVIAFGQWNHALRATSTDFTRTASEGLFVSRIFPSSGGIAETKVFCEATALCIANGIATNSKGHAVITGRYVGTIAFSAATSISTSDPSSDAYVAKLDEAFEPLWAFSLGGPGAQEGFSVAAVPGTDDFVIAADFTSEVVSPSGKTFAAKGGISERDIFVARVNGSGAIVWETTFGDAGDEHAGGIAVDASGRVFVGGTFTSSTIDFGGGVLTNAGKDGLGTRDAFIVSLDANGQHLFSQRFGNSGDEDCRLAGVDANGGVVLVGEFTKFLDFGPVVGLLTAHGLRDAFVLRLEP